MSFILPAGETPLAVVTVKVSVTVLATFLVLPVAFTRPDTLLLALVTVTAVALEVAGA